MSGDVCDVHERHTIHKCCRLLRTQRICGIIARDFVITQDEKDGKMWYCGKERTGVAFC